jgi:hypothetical protein
VSGVASASTINLNFYSTGFDNSGILLVGTASGVADGNWTLVSAPSGSPTPLTAYVTQDFPGAWVNTDPTQSQWISPTINEPYPGVEDLPGIYEYQQTFYLASDVNVNSVVIAGEWAADNNASIRVNGADVISDPTNSYGQFTPFILNSSNAAFVSGALNTITFLVNNASDGDPRTNPSGANPSGLNVHILGATADVTDSVPEPASLACIGTGLCALGFFARKRRKSRA